MKFPKLPGLSKLFKKRSGDDDDFDDDEIDDDSDDEIADEIADEIDDEIDDDFDDDDDEDGEGKVSRKPLMIIAAGSFVLLAGIIGGAGWWYFGDTSEAPAKTAQKPDAAAKGPRVRMAMPAKAGSLNALLSTPPGKTAVNRGRPSAAAGKKPVMTPAASGPAKAAAADPLRARRAGDIGGKFGGRANPLSGSLNAIGSAQGAALGVVIPAVTSVTIRKLPNNPGGKPLGPTPDVRLVEKKEGLPGVLPNASPDGSMPWQVYARPYEAKDDRPKVAIAIIGLGLSRAATMAAIGKLPPEITLVLDPYAKGLGDWLVRARRVGHEVMVALPMESESFPIHDAGPFSMDTGLKVEDNLKRLELVLSQFSGYTGVATVMGSRFGTSESLLRPVLGVLKERGLMLITAGTLFLSAVPKVAFEIGLPRVISDITLDDEPSRAAIMAKLVRLEEIARERSVGVAIARAYPATIDRLIVWTKSLEGKKMVLVPVSAVADTTQKPQKKE